MANPVTTNLAIVPVDTGKIPKNGAKAVPADYDFSVSAAWDTDLTLLKQQGKIEVIQSIFIDNANNNQSIVVTVSGTRQAISVPAQYQGLFPVFVTDRARFTVTSSGSGKAQVQYSNAPIDAAALWAGTAIPFNPTGTITVTDPILDATVTGNRVQVLMTEAPDTTVDRSGTAGLASAQAAAGNANRQEFFIQNLSLAATIGVRLGSAAAIGVPGTITLFPGASLRQPGIGSINVIADTAATPYTCLEW